MRAYYDRKRPLTAWSLGLGVVLALALARWPLPASALFVGTLCGLGNAFLMMRGNERLVDHGSVAAFVFSSILRIGVFGIVPVAFALHGPAWSFATYFAGFFTPLALYATFVGRAVRTG